MRVLLPHLTREAAVVAKPKGLERINVNIPLTLEQPLELTDGTFDIPGDFFLTSTGSQYYTFPYGQNWTVRQGSSDLDYQSLFHVNSTGGMYIATNTESDIEIASGVELKVSADEITIDANLDNDGEQTAINLNQNGDLRFRIRGDSVVESVVQVSSVSRHPSAAVPPRADN